MSTASTQASVERLVAQPIWHARSWNKRNAHARLYLKSPCRHLLRFQELEREERRSLVLAEGEVNSGSSECAQLCTSVLYTASSFPARTHCHTHRESTITSALSADLEV